MSSLLSRLLDLREGESGVALRTFATLFLIVAGHTTLETARDAIFLSHLPPSQLNVVYVLVAALTLVATAASGELAVRFGRRNALICSLVVAAYVTVWLYFLAPTPRVAWVLYLFSGLLGAMLTPQFWLLAAQLFTVAQGRRLFGPIASGGVLGATMGAGGAALALRFLPVSGLLPLAALLFTATALLLTTLPPNETLPSAGARQTSVRPTSLREAFRTSPFLFRIAALVALSTAAVLTVDYQFKSTAVRFVAPADLGGFFARYYAVMNGVSLLVQVVLAGRIVRNVGVVGALTVMPLLLLGGGVAVLVGGGAWLVVLGLKTVDGGLRYSLNRVATELLYLPLVPEARERARGFVDGALGRVAQAATAIVLYILATRALATPRVLAVVLVSLCAGWLALAINVRTPYLDLFRRALATGGIGPDTEIQELDLPSAEALVEAMASPDPATVVAVMRVLHEHRRTRLIPALILLHPVEQVLLRALEIFGTSERTDWIPFATNLLNHSSEPVRVAVVRALAKKGRTEALQKAATDESPRVRAYAAYFLALREEPSDLTRHRLVRLIMEKPGDVGRESRRGLLAALSDAPDERAIDLLIAFGLRPELDDDEEAVDQMARAIAVIGSPRLLPLCIARLGKRVGRESIRQALVAIGDPALDALEEATRVGYVDRRVRLHIPRSISRFGSQRAADFLSVELERENDGLVRYKILRALGQLVAANDVRIDRVLIEKQAHKNLEEYLRLLSLGVALANGHDPAGRLLQELLADKVSQSLQRAFRLLKIAHKREDFHRVHTAALSSDRNARASAGEFLESLLSRRDQQGLRQILRLVVDEVSDAERVRRAIEDGRPLARTREEALAMLVDDPDDALAALAAQYALALDDRTLSAAVVRARELRPSLKSMGAHLFGAGLRVAEAVGG